jgi:hypothetical protein
MKPIRFKAELILNTETHTTGTGPMELAAQIEAKSIDALWKLRTSFQTAQSGGGSAKWLS